MRLILTGIEYAGKRTLASEIEKWWARQTGAKLKREPPYFNKFHDHFTVPYIMHPVGHHSPDEVEKGQRHILTLPPGLMEYFQRYNIMNKFSLGYAINYIEYPDLFMIDWYYSDAVYAPLYYGYGGVGEYADRRRMARKRKK